MPGKVQCAGRVRLVPEVRELLRLLRHLVQRWYVMVRNRRDSTIPAGNNRLEGWFGRFSPRARLTRGLKTETGVLNFVHLMAHGMA